MVKLRLYDTLYGLVLVTAASLIAISVLLTVNYVRLIPEEPHDAMFSVIRVLFLFLAMRRQFIKAIGGFALR